jgi:hypothetical protein
MKKLQILPLFENRGRGKRNETIMEEVNLFKVCCTHMWNYYNESPHIINVC